MSNDKSKNIIDINSANEQKPTPPLTGQQIQNIGAAYARLMELKNQKVLTVNTETEVKGLLEFLSSELIAHADEFIACWLAVRTEYEVLLNTFGRMLTRVDGMRAAQAQRQVKRNEEVQKVQS